ncbi:OadG family protein [Natronospora cellulosivora (SeqCode)]
MDILREGLQVTIIGMGLVFFVLVSMMILLKLFSAFLYKEEKTPGKEKVKVTAAKQKNDNIQVKRLEEEISVITAVMTEILDENETIVSINAIN